MPQTRIHLTAPRLPRIGRITAAPPHFGGKDACPPNAFNTTRYSEKLLQPSGIGVSTLDLSDVFGRAKKLSDPDRRLTHSSSLAALRA